MDMLVIHIGYHKTGTTLLQKQVFSRSELGLCTPWGTQAHKAVDEFITVNPFLFEPQSCRNRLGDQICEAREAGLVPIMSQEALSGRAIGQAFHYGPYVAERLAAVFPQAKILITIREQKASVISHYRQYIANGGVHSIERFIGADAQKPGFTPVFYSDHLKYDRLIETYITLFGRDSVMVLPAEKLFHDTPSALSQLSGFIGAAASYPVTLQPERVGMKGVEIKMRRFMNGCGNAFLPDNSRKKSPVGHRWSSRLCRIGKLFPAAGERKMREIVNYYYTTYYNESNRRLMELTGIDLATMGYEY